MAFISGATHTLQWAVQWAAKGRPGANLIKAVRSSDCRLKLAYMKLELLVIADQNAAVNTFPGLVHTARHTMKVGCTRSRCANRKEAGAQGMVDDWGEVVTR